MAAWRGGNDELEVIKKKTLVDMSPIIRQLEIHMFRALLFKASVVCNMMVLSISKPFNCVLILFSSSA